MIECLRSRRGECVCTITALTVMYEGNTKRERAPSACSEAF